MLSKIAAISAFIFLTHALYCDDNWWFLNGVEVVWSELLRGYRWGSKRELKGNKESSIRNFIGKACERTFPKKTPNILVAYGLGEHKG